MATRVLIVGSGGREHALAWKLAQSERVSQIFVVPGNGGTATLKKTENVSDVNAESFGDLLAFAVKQKINLLVPGPEAPLVAGIADYFVENGPASIAIFGPSEAAARMEGSKAFSKDFMKRHNIPTAIYETFHTFDDAKAWLDSHKNMKVVIKADGLAAGKGVIIPESYEESIAGLKQIMQDREFGAAGDVVVIEEFLEGQELSVLSFSDGHTVLSLPAAQDHKRALDGDQGLNTGGMGCYAPTQIATPEVMARIHRETLQPTIDGLRKEDTPFVGCLFTGFMLTKDGPKVLEYNVRFGDPECQTLLPLLENDLADLMLRSTRHTLDSVQLRLKDAFSTTVVVAAGGYPGKYAKGTPLQVDPVAADTYIFHAGTAVSSTSPFITTGGRVIAATATAPSIPSAVERAYAGVSSIKFEGMHFRRDIAHRALKHQATTAEALTYASSGVSIDAGNDLVRKIKTHLQSTSRPGSAPFTGGFGGTLSLPEAGYHPSSPTLVLAIDGIGTKLMIAVATGILDTVGIDLVAMNVNDLIVQGAEPLAFLDYYACSALNVAHAERFVAGVAHGCVLARSALVGGETAEMPGIYSPGDFDAAGCAIGALKPGRPVLPVVDSMRAGDIVLGIASSGIHSNGFSLVRRIVAREGLAYNDAAPWAEGRNVGEELLVPTKIYVRSLAAVLDRAEKEQALLIKGLAHITGGGLTENIPRMLPDGLAARLDANTWEVPKVLRWLRKAGNVEVAEFARSFNTGLGMVAVVDPAHVATVENILKAEGETVFRVGELVKRTGEGVELLNTEKWTS